MVFFLLVVICAQSLFGAGNDNSFRIEAKKAFGVLPKQMESGQNTITPEKVFLGKILYYEMRVSVDGTVSCAKCHPFGLYATDGLEKAIGNNGKVNPRNAPTLLNASSQVSAHWIGNRLNVEDQAKQALIGPPSYGMPSYEAAEKKLRSIPGYGPLFKRAFPGDGNPITADNFAKAVGAFERTLVTPSPFDDFLKGDTTALSGLAKSGLKIFLEARCADCHSGACLGGQMYQKFGVAEPYQAYTKSKTVDEGRFVVTKSDGDKYVFKVPVLRNVAMTSPYFHDGSVAKLREAIVIMGKVQLSESFTDSQVEAVFAFLKSLTGKIPDDALILPVLPPVE